VTTKQLGIMPINGILHRFDHRPLPVCVHGKIMDSWPDPDYVYVRFQSAVKDVVDHQ
jgi:hypothetical protein